MDDQPEQQAHGVATGAAVTVVLGPPQRPDADWVNIALLGALNLFDAPGFDVLSAPEETMAPAVAELVAAGRPTVVVSGMVTHRGTPWLLDALAADPATAAAGRVLVCVDPVVGVTWERVDRSSVDLTMTVPLVLGSTEEDRAALRATALLRSYLHG